MARQEGESLAAARCDPLPRTLAVRHGTGRPLPGPAFSRSLTLIARRQELGRLPREAAAFCRRALADEVLPGLRRALPWLPEGAISAG